MWNTVRLSQSTRWRRVWHSWRRWAMELSTPFLSWYYCNEPHLVIIQHCPIISESYLIRSTWDYQDKQLKDLPLYHYFDGSNVTLLPYNEKKKNRCVRKWNGECIQYECRDCYDCDENTEECKDNISSKWMCESSEGKYEKDKKEIKGCNYDSFTEDYLTDDYVNRVNARKK